MASSQKISQLTTAGPLTGAELVPIVQNSGTLQTTVSVLKAFSLGNIENEVSILNARVDAVSIIASQETGAIASLSAAVTDLTLRVAAVSASVSALQVQVNAVSVLTSLNAAAIISVNAAITSVNAVVSTKVSRVGDFMDSVQYIEFDTSTVVATSAGRLSWSLDEGTLDIGFANAGVILHSGLQLYERLYNDTASTLTKGTVVRITGSQGQRLTAAPALADGDANSASTFAIMAENVAAGSSGFAVVTGVLKNVNTGGIADGTTLWLSPTSAGQYTPTKPVAPQHLVLVGYVVKGNSVGGGSIYVKVINGFELGELHDVKISASSSLANNEVLAYNTSAGVWTNSTVLLDAQASISALNVQLAAVSSQVSSNAAAITSTNNVVSALEIRVSTVSTRASALDVRLAAVSASVSALQIQVNAVSAALTSTNNVVSALEIRVSAVSALVVAGGPAITSINNVVSALEVRVSSISAAVVSVGMVAANVSALVSALDIRVAAVSASVSALQVQVNTVSAALTSTNNVVSALEIRVSAASATNVVQTAAITSINNVVSALEIRVSAVSAIQTQVNAVSALVSALDIRIAAVSASVSALQIQVNAVSAALTSTNQYVSTLGDGLIIEINTLADRVTQVEASVSVINTRLPVGTVVGTTDTQTLTNKRINPRSFVTTTGVSLTPDISQFDMYAFTALAAAISVNPPTGTPVNGNKLILRFKDNGVSRTITWTTAGANSYRAVGVSLPASTSVSKVTYVGCMYNADETFWDVLAVTTQA